MSTTRQRSDVVRAKLSDKALKHVTFFAALEGKHVGVVAAEIIETYLGSAECKQRISEILGQPGGRHASGIQRR